MDAYTLLLTCHVGAVIVWMGGMLTSPLLIAVIAEQPEALREQLARRVRRWYRSVTDPAIMLAWGLGIFLIVEGGWWPANWLLVKLALATLLASLHGMFAFQLRRLATRPGYSPWVGPVRLLLLQCATVLMVVALVESKPL